jgi:hypothetical protein
MNSQGRWDGSSSPIPKFVTPSRPSGDKNSGCQRLSNKFLEQVAAGAAWATIVSEWRGDISQDAIAEAVQIANAAPHRPHWVNDPPARKQVTNSPNPSETASIS